MGGVDDDVAPSVRFSEAMDVSTINSTNVTLIAAAGGSPVVTTVSYDEASHTASVKPTGLLSYTASYTLSVSPGVKDVAGNMLGTTVSSAFSTRDPAAPSVLLDRIVFTNIADGSVRIFHVGITGGEAVQLPTPGLNPGCPVVSPDGKRVAFVANQSLFVMNADGSNPRDLGRSLVAYATHIACPSWSPDSQKLAFVRVFSRIKNAAESQLYLINRDGSGLVQLVSGDSFYSVLWAPTGDNLLLSSSQFSGNGGPFDFALSILRLDGTQVTRISQPWSGADWSPDGIHFAFICGTATERRLCVGATDGSSSAPLSDPGVIVSSIDWAPDGRRIVFICNLAVCTVNPDGTGKQTLVSTGVRVADPVWSPDSRMIVYASSPAGPYAVNPDGTSNRSVTTLPGPSSEPTFSPMSH
jgi:Tol biopolymer transport system component